MFYTSKFQRPMHLFDGMVSTISRVFVVLFSFIIATHALAQTTDFESELKRLTTRDYDQIRIAVTKIGELRVPHGGTVLLPQEAEEEDCQRDRGHPL